VWAQFANDPLIMRAHPYPQLPPSLQLIARCVVELDNDRINTGGQIGGIPFSSIIAWMAWQRIEQQEQFLSLVQFTDQQLIHHWRSQLHQKKLKAKKGGANG
jgi:hypothetical protein